MDIEGSSCTECYDCICPFDVKLNINYIIQFKAELPSCRNRSGIDTRHVKQYSISNEKSYFELIGLLQYTSHLLVAVIAIPHVSLVLIFSSFELNVSLFP